MILRRFTKHLTDQNWFAVLLDLIVVITGIFIGLQVTEWNQHRKDALREVQYLERISDDLQTDINGQKLAMDLATLRMDYGYFLLDAVDHPEKITAQPTYFIKALDQAGYTFSAEIAKTTFQELTFAGDLNLIQDVKLRTQLSHYYDYLESSTQWNYNRSHVQTTYNTLNAGILKPNQIGAYGSRDYLEFTQQEAEVAYEAFLNRPDFINWIPHAIESNRESYRNAEKGLIAAEELKQAIQEILSDD